jgi:ferrous iron transport protein A
LKSDFNFDRSRVPLASLAPGECAEVRWVDGASPIGRRLLELGFRPGTPLRVIRRAPLGDPTTYELRGSRFCLRRAEAERVEVVPMPPQ